MISREWIGFGIGLALLGSAASAEVRTTGYLETRDGTLLHYDLRRPDATGTFPTLFLFSGYGDTDPLVNAGYPPILARGYAVILVSMRGTGCSEGTWELLGPHDGPDGYDAIEWIAAQPWSDERVGMFGGSLGALVQPFVAAEKPPHLKAISMLSPVADLYRDAAYPGGLPNVGLAGFLTVSQAGFSAIGTVAPLSVASPEDAVICLANHEERPLNATVSPAVLLEQHAWEDELIRAHSPFYRLDDIDVPVFFHVTWPDGVTGARAIHTLESLDVPYHAVFGNGGHLSYEMVLLPRVLDFMDHYVKGIENGFESSPPVELWWEVRQAGPRWTSELWSWPPVEALPRRLYLSSDGALRDGSGIGDPDAYAYLGGGGQHHAPGIASYTGWHEPAAPGASLAYTSEPLTQDLLVVGSASVDLWLSSSAPDTDVQVTLTEVRADGSEIFVQKGWLRASHRSLDPNRSTETRPYHTHRSEDAQTLEPGQPELMRIEIFPFANAFRAGTRIRLYVEAPHSVPDPWLLEPLPAPAINLVHHDTEHPSALVLPSLPGTVPPGITTSPCDPVNGAALTGRWCRTPAEAR